MRYINCNLCGKNDYVLLESCHNDEYYKSRVGVRVVICKICGLVYNNPQLDSVELQNLYSETYVGTHPADVEPDPELVLGKEIGVEGILGWLIDKRVNGVVRRANDKPNRVLDIGCGEGSLLGGLRKRGFECYGVEPTPYYAEYARRKYGVNVITGFFEAASFPSNYFDMIVLFHVLEHFPNPTSALRRIRGLLKDDGLIYIGVPNIFRLGHFRCFQAPHLYNYSANTLDLMLRKVGFELADMDDSGNIVALARKGIVGTIDFAIEGDDYREILRVFKWRRVRIIPALVKRWLIRLISQSVRRVFGQQRGRKILNRVSRFAITPSKG